MSVKEAFERHLQIRDGKVAARYEGDLKSDDGSLRPARPPDSPEVLRLAEGAAAVLPQIYRRKGISWRQKARKLSRELTTQRPPERVRRSSPPRLVATPRGDSREARLTAMQRYLPPVFAFPDAAGPGA
jgi:hypothetical protein